MTCSLLSKHHGRRPIPAASSASTRLSLSLYPSLFVYTYFGSRDCECRESRKSRKLLWNSALWSWVWNYGRTLLEGRDWIATTRSANFRYPWRTTGLTKKLCMFLTSWVYESSRLRESEGSVRTRERWQRYVPNLGEKNYCGRPSRLVNQRGHCHFKILQKCWEICNCLSRKRDTKFDWY